MKFPMTLLERHLRPHCPSYESGRGQCPRHVPALRCPCSFLFEASVVRETKFTLSKFWCSSAAIIGAKQLIITDSHFLLAMANLGSKFFETSLEVVIRTFERLSVNSSVIHKSSFFRCEEQRLIRMSSFEEVCHTRRRQNCLNRIFLFFWFLSGCQYLSVHHG